MSINSLLIGLLLITSTLAHPQDDLIVDLPGTQNLTFEFRQYSGYLNATEGRFLHYWLVESQNDWETDPLLLWLNGGPGCSSLLGLLTELGPFYVVDSKTPTLGIMEYSWNRNASVLFLESPACVGYSFDVDGNCDNNDTSTALQNYLALQHFFSEFGEYAINDFYITGESYAGIYIPMLAAEIMAGQETFPINFKGFAIGNGLLDYSDNTNTLMAYSHYHTILDESLWERMVEHCCEGGLEDSGKCDFVTNKNVFCNLDVLEATLKTYYEGLNIYNLYGECEGGSSSSKVSRESFDRENLYGSILERDDTNTIPCVNNDKEVEYLNLPEVREALHIPDELQTTWDVCTRLFRYGREVENTTIHIDKLVKEGIRGLIYNGDNDMSVNFLGNEWEVESLNLKVIENYRSWWSAENVGGYVKRFENLDFLTVRGAGHMVPEDKPQQAFEMIMSFLTNQTYPEGDSLLDLDLGPNILDKLS